MDSWVGGLGSGLGLCVIVFGVVNEMAADTVGAEANRVESAAGFGLIFRVTVEVSQFVRAMRKLTLAAIFTQTPFGKCAAQLGLVA